MFVRCRQNNSRLQVSLVETSRIDGKVRHEHIASIGSVDVLPSVEDRLAFWQRLHERLANPQRGLPPSNAVKFTSKTPSSAAAIGTLSAYPTRFLALARSSAAPGERASTRLGALLFADTRLTPLGHLSRCPRRMKRKNEEEQLVADNVRRYTVSRQIQHLSHP